MVVVVKERNNQARHTGARPLLAPKSPKDVEGDDSVNFISVVTFP